MSDGDPTLASWSAHENKLQSSSLKEEEHKVQTDQFNYQQAEMNPSRNLLHKFFIFFSMVTIVTLLLLGAAQFITIYHADLEVEVNVVVEYVISVYVCTMCALAVFIELEFGSFIIRSKILTFWPSRGLIYVFMGFLTLEQNEISNLKSDRSEAAQTFVTVISFIIIVIGLLYVIMGLLCLQVVLHKMRENYKARRAAGSQKAQAIRRNPNLRVSQPGALELA
mmetsp:Transcript_3747/g.5121  ORF Transcript_3747/g.5121 Transcript_3747/m.5121 type:complete len:223 (-) Transcript_3747:177-845(-)